MKVYYSAGLKELAAASGFRGETLKKLASCSNFKRTHRFLQQAWEAIYQQMLCSYMQEQSESDAMNQQICAVILKANNHPSGVLSKVKQLLSKLICEQNFYDFVQKKLEADETGRYW